MEALTCEGQPTTLQKGDFLQWFVPNTHEEGWILLAFRITADGHTRPLKWKGDDKYLMLSVRNELSAFEVVALLGATVGCHPKVNMDYKVKTYELV